MFLLRVQLPDVPGSLGRLATAIGWAGGDIEAIEIIEKNPDGNAVDDVLLSMAHGTMPDSIVSACSELEGVHVIWISRYAAGGNLFLDLEVVEELTAEPDAALERLVALLPVTFRVDWAARVRAGDELVTATDSAPSEVAFSPLGRPRRLPDNDGTVLCGAPVDADETVVLGRAGGPAFLDSELARLGHLVALAISIARPSSRLG